MVLDKPILPFFQWLLPSVEGKGALFLFLLMLAGLLAVSLFIAYLRMALLLGPGEGFYAVAKAIAEALTKDFPHSSLRRLWAITLLAVREALRRWVLVVFVVFLLLLLAAGWFLDVRSDHPAQVYLSFVLTATEFLTLLVAILLSAFSLPNDIKFKTIHTVVTKPVRASEIVLGRILGFGLVGTALLAMTCLVSYFFVVRGLNHRHRLTADDLEAVKGEAGAAGWQGRTSSDAFHRHEVTLGADGQGYTHSVMDHNHAIAAVTRGGRTEYQVGAPKGALAARIPLYGRLRFVGRDGKPDQGISVGKEWSYRRFIEGASPAAAIWTFDGITPERFPEGLPLELTLSVFRTHKGDIVSGIQGAITLRNPRSGSESEPLPFTATEYVTGTHHVPRSLKGMDKDGSLRDIDLYQLTDGGRVELQIQCTDPGQYFGMAQADVYVRGRDAMFFWNFVKGYIGIWLQMVIITCFGVVFSTFLSGPVAMFATGVAYVVGLQRQFVIDVATGVEVGGGPIESALKIVAQRSIMTDLDMGLVLDFTVPKLDAVLNGMMWMVAHILPDFTSFNTSRFVAYGFNIDGNLLVQHCLIMLAYVVVLTIYGYFFLRAREIAR